MLADAVVVLHFGFVGFVALGGFLVLRWPRLAWAHVPAVIWGAGIELTGWICPLTPLEHALRARAGQAAYGGDFVARYILPVLYPEGLTRTAQLVLGGSVLLGNLLIYAWILRQRTRRHP